jgi:peptide/nickel transport system permease protein
MTRVGAALVAAWIVAGLFAPFLAPNPPATQFEFPYAPPMRPRIVDAHGRSRAPFVYPVRVASLIERRYELDRSRPVSLVWFSNGRLASTADPSTPLLLLGTDAIGRDVFARLLYGARASLGVAILAGLCALLAGALAGTAAGYAGGWIEDGIMRAADLLMLLPAIYVVLALRAVMPLDLGFWQVFWSMTAILALVGWPHVARPVRAIIATESRREYVEAARALGAGPTRVISRYLVPASGHALVTQATLLLPAFLLAEATLSYVGLGFPEPTASWGTMLLEAGRNVRAMAEYPWVLAPGAAIILFVLGLHLAAGPASHAQPLTDTSVRISN